MPSRRRGTIVGEAAYYFGISDDEQWTAIKVGRKECILIARASRKGRVIAYYSERFREPHGEYIWLTENQRAALVEALSHEF